MGQSASAIPRGRNLAGFQSGLGCGCYLGLNGVQSRAHLRRHRLRDCSKWTLRPCLSSFRALKLSATSEFMPWSPGDAVDVDNDGGGGGGLDSSSLILWSSRMFMNVSEASGLCPPSSCADSTRKHSGRQASGTSFPGCQDRRTLGTQTY